MAFVPETLREGPFHRTCETCTNFKKTTASVGTCAIKPHRKRVSRLATCSQYSAMLGADQLPERLPPPSKRSKAKPAISESSVDHLTLAIQEIKAERDATIKRIDDKIKALRAEILELEESRDNYLIGIDTSVTILRKMKGDRPNGNTHQRPEDHD